MMKKPLFISSVLAPIFLTAALHANEPTKYEFNAGFNISGGATATVAVDCDLLDSEGQPTIAFIAQLDPYRHFDEERKINAVRTSLKMAARRSDNSQPVTDDDVMNKISEHINAHGVSDQTIAGIIQKCRRDYPQKYNLQP